MHAEMNAIYCLAAVIHICIFHAVANGSAIWVCGATH